MSPNQTPIKFSAGGNKSSSSTNKPRQNTPPPASSPTQISSSSDVINPPVHNGTLSIITNGLLLKRSPLHLKNWIACLLTLDGRDKFTKVLQYGSRMLAWWFGTLAGSAAAANSSSIGLLLDPSKRLTLYKLLSVRFNLLYKSFVESRKAFRMGRTFIEYDKLRSMGWGDYLIRVLGEEVRVSDEKKHDLRSQYATHSIPEHHDEDNSDHEGQESWNEDEEEDEKKIDVQKVVARPGRPHLPSRVSSNIGWGPGMSSNEPSETEAAKKGGKSPPSRTVSELGAMYQSSRSSSMGWIKKTDAKEVTKAETPQPGWKLVGSTLKLIGLMGFWTFDNLAFLTGTGFLDPINTNDPKSLRLQRKKRASEWGARFYFMGALAGLYVNSRGVWEHSSGALQRARRELEQCLLTQSGNESAEEVSKAKQQLKQAETKHFELYVALLKSICDCIVFSNNPGVDLHLKYRGKKNHEGLHCCCGLMSAGTVLFGNFPNA